MASLKYLDPTTGQYVQIPFRPTAQVISVNGYDGIVNLHTSDIIDLTTDLAKKVDEPTREGTAGQVLSTDGAGHRTWITVDGTVKSVNSVNPDTNGNVNLLTSNIKNSANKTIDTLLDEKLDEPTGGSANDVVIKTASGTAWKTLGTASDKDYTATLSATGANLPTEKAVADYVADYVDDEIKVDGAKINGTDATITDKKIIIPAADTTKYGVVKLDETKGITAASGILQFTDDAREILDAAASDVVAAKYVATSSYVVGDVVTYGEEVYVCKAATTGTWDATKWKKTNEQNELMNMMTQMFTALGLSCSKTWDATNNKVDYGFTING